MGIPLIQLSYFTLRIENAFFGVGMSCWLSSTIVRSSQMHCDVLSDEGRVDLKLLTSINSGIIVLQARSRWHVLIVPKIFRGRMKIEQEPGAVVGHTTTHSRGLCGNEEEPTISVRHISLSIGIYKK